VTAEGVERPETLERLRAFGCDKAQGYLLGRPMDPDQFLEFAREQQAVGAVTPRVSLAPPAATLRRTRDEAVGVRAVA
jgi:predicted signal transduction protein with EAL and GGDEF domain